MLIELIASQLISEIHGMGNSSIGAIPFSISKYYLIKATDKYASKQFEQL